MRRFVRVKLELALGWRSFWDGAECATPGTEIAQNHEGGSSPIETLVDIGATSRFADCVKIARSKFRLQQMNRLEMRSALSQPLREPGTCTRSRLNLNERIQVGEPLLYRLGRRNS